MYAEKKEENLSFPARIVCTSGRRYSITIPKRMIDTGIINPNDDFVVILLPIKGKGGDA